MVEPTFTRDLRSMPLWLLREYLVELGGRAVDDATVEGDGWTARLTRLPDFQVGSLRVGEVRVEIGGEPQAVAALLVDLEPRLARAGG